MVGKSVDMLDIYRPGATEVNPPPLAGKVWGINFVEQHLRGQKQLVLFKNRVAVYELLPLKGHRVHFLAKISNTINSVLFHLKA